MVEAPAGPLLVYIAGYGHSGSTILEILLGQRSQPVDGRQAASVLTLGEVAFAPRALRREGGRCTCGRAHADCPVWGPQMTSLRDAPGQLSADGHAALIARIVAGSGSPSHVIDSSKTAWRLALRPWRLQQPLGLRVAVLHLVRDPRAVAWSNIRAFERKRPAGRLRRAWIAAKSAAGWSVANAGARLAARLGGLPLERLRYEDFAAARPGTETTLPALGLTLVHRPVVEGTGGDIHQVAGNRIRHAGAIPVAFDDAWRGEMSRGLQHLAGVLSLGKRRYGYSGRR